MSRKLVLALIIALVAALMLSGIAYAITIVVDGVREAAWDGSGGQIPGSIDDSNETITDGYDIERIQWTNDGTNFYFLVQTYANTLLGGNPIPTIIICLDIDSNPLTGGTYANCNNMTGIDRSLLLTRNGVEVYNSDPNTGLVVANGTRATATNITEASISLASLGFSTGNCPADIPYAVYFDNGITDPDDNVPDNGILSLSCGGPTAVELASLQARPTTTSPVVPVALMGGSAAALIGVVFLIRRNHKKAA